MICFFTWVIVKYSHKRKILIIQKIVYYILGG